MDDKVIPLFRPPAAKIIGFPKATAPATDHQGEHWGSALDMLKELVNDIEAGRIPEPVMCYIAMQTRSPQDERLVQYPSYLWSAGATAGLAVIGLLQKHVNKLCNPQRAV